MKTRLHAMLKIRVISLISGMVLLASAAFAQGVRYDNVVLLDSGRPVQGATITVCASGSSGTPCTPTTSIFNDAAMGSPITQPGFQSGAQGNYNFYAACGKYDISLTGNGLTGRTMKDVQLGPCGNYLAKLDFTAQSANIGSTLLYAVPAGLGGQYRVTCSIVITQAATTSSTLPACEVVWTNADTNTVEPTTSLTGTSSANVVGGNQGSGGALGGNLISVKAGTNINFATLGYASVGATAMQFTIHVRLEYLGN